MQQVAQHLLTQDRVHARLVALALGLEPGKDVRVHTHGRRRLGGLIQRVANRILQERPAQLGLILVVDLRFWRLGERLQLGTLLGRQGGQVAQIDFMPNYLAHKASFPSCRHDGPR